MKNNTIIELEGSDIISESMHKINDNFRILAEQDEQDRYKWDSYIKSIKEEIEGLKQVVDLRNIDVSRIINGLSDKVNRMPTQSDIQAMVDNALRNTEGILSNTIQKLSNVYVDEYLDGYTKHIEEDIDSLQDNLTTISQTIIHQMSGDNFAQVTIAAANNKFYTVHEGNSDYLVYNINDYNSLTSRENAVSSDPEIEAHSSYKYLDEFLCGGLNPDEQKDILDTFENITDQEELKKYFPCGDDENPFIHWPEDDQYYEENCLKLMAYDKAYKVFMSVCQKVFKTIAKEVATIVASVGDGYSETEIINKAFGEHGEEIQASITSWANTYGSGIHLKAGQIILNAENQLTLTSENCSISATDNITIDAPNFKLKQNGDVEVEGKITATELVIKSDSSAAESLANFIKGVGHTEGWDENGGGESGGGSNPEPYDDTWLTNAFGEIKAGGGILLAGNLLVGDSSANVTAGMMGANNDRDDLRIFAGSRDFDSRESSPFKVYKSGKLIAKDAEITGKVTASELVINDDSFLNNLTVKHITAENDGTLSTVIDPGIFQIRYGGETVVDFFVNDEGYVTLRFKGPDGTWITIDGKNGYQQLSDITVVPSEYIPVKLAPFDSADISVITYYLRNPSQYSDIDITVPGVVTYYRYSVGYMLNTKTSEKKYYNINTGKYDLISIPSENGKIFTQQDARSEFLANVSYSYPNVKGEYDPNASYFAYPVAIDYGSYVPGDNVWVYNASLVSISNGVINTNVGTLQTYRDAYNNPKTLSVGDRVLTSNRNISDMEPDH